MGVAPRRFRFKTDAPPQAAEQQCRPAATPRAQPVATPSRTSTRRPEVSKLKVAQLDELLRMKNVTPKGLKAEKAEMVAWHYTHTWRQQQAAARPPPAEIESGQRRIEDFFGQ